MSRENAAPMPLDVNDVMVQRVMLTTAPLLHLGGRRRRSGLDRGASRIVGDKGAGREKVDFVYII